MDCSTGTVGSGHRGSVTAVMDFYFQRLCMGQGMQSMAARVGRPCMHTPSRVSQALRRVGSQPRGWPRGCATLWEQPASTRGTSSPSQLCSACFATHLLREDEAHSCRHAAAGGQAALSSINTYWKCPRPPHTHPPPHTHSLPTQPPTQTTLTPPHTLTQLRQEMNR